MLQLPAYSEMLAVTLLQLSAWQILCWAGNSRSWKITVIWCTISRLLSTGCTKIAQFCPTRRDEQSRKEDWILDGSLAQLYNLPWAHQNQICWYKIVCAAWGYLLLSEKTTSRFTQKMNRFHGVKIIADVPQHSKIRSWSLKRPSVWRRQCKGWLLLTWRPPYCCRLW